MRAALLVSVLTAVVLADAAGAQSPEPPPRAPRREPTRVVSVVLGSFGGGPAEELESVMRRAGYTDSFGGCGIFFWL